MQKLKYIGRVESSQMKIGRVKKVLYDIDGGDLCFLLSTQTKLRFDRFPGLKYVLKRDVFRSSRVLQFYPVIAEECCTMCTINFERIYIADFVTRNGGYGAIKTLIATQSAEYVFEYATC